MSHLAITLENLSGKPVDIKFLLPLLKKSATLQKIRAGQWHITIVHDAAMKKLHLRTLNLPTTTDVLTFDLRDTPPVKTQNPKLKISLDLDTVLCRDQAARQAKLRRHSLTHELLLYAIHSLLHVTGYDDLTPADAARIHAREDEILRALGVGPVYASPEKPENPTRQKRIART